MENQSLPIKKIRFWYILDSNDMRWSTNGQYQMIVLVFSRNIIDMEVIAEASLRHESSPKEFVDDKDA